MTTYIYRATYTKGMNTRPDHNVSNSPNGTVAYNVPTDCVEVWVAPADGVGVKKGDQWAKLSGAIVKWVAVVHLGVVYGTVEAVGEPDPDPDPQPVAGFPESVVITNNDPTHPDFGKQAEYTFVRVLP